MSETKKMSLTEFKNALKPFTLENPERNRKRIT